MLNKLKSISKTILIILVIIFLAWGLTRLRDCGKPKPQVSPTEATQDSRIERKEYTPVSIPIIKDKPPVKQENLPIPKEQVKTTIVVKTHTPEGTGPVTADVTLVIDKQDKVYLTKDSPQEVKVTSVTWKPKVFELGHRFSYTFAYNFEGTYHCLSYNPVRIGKFYIGADLGMGTRDEVITGYMVGVSVKYPIFSIISAPGESSRLDALVVLGRDFLGERIYVGFGFSFGN